jgi:hypothetical protein
MSIQRLATLLLLVLLSACAAVDTSAPKLDAVKTIGVVSAIGDELTLTKAGLTGFENRTQSFSIESWGIDDLIVSRANSLLSRRFEVHPVTYRRVALAALEGDSAITAVNLLRDDPIKKLIPTEVTPLGLDAYVMITKAKSKYGSTSRTVEGFGIINHSAVFGSYAQIHALYVVRVIDGHGFNLIEKRSASPLNNTEMFRLAGPSRLVDASFLPTANDAAQNEPLKAAIIDLIEHSLPATLHDLGLVDP